MANKSFFAISIFVVTGLHCFFPSLSVAQRSTVLYTGLTLQSLHHVPKDELKSIVTASGKKPSELARIMKDAFRVLYVDDASPAVEAGIKQGDILVTFNGLRFAILDVMESHLQKIEKEQTNVVITVQFFKQADSWQNMESVDVPIKRIPLKEFEIKQQLVKARRILDGYDKVKLQNGECTYDTVVSLFGKPDSERNTSGRMVSIAYGAGSSYNDAVPDKRKCEWIFSAKGKHSTVVLVFWKHALPGQPGAWMVESKTMND